MSLKEKILRAVLGGPTSKPTLPTTPVTIHPLAPATKEAIEAQIDAFLRKVGVTDPASQTDEKGWRHFQRGSAQGQAGVIKIEEDWYLRVESSVFPLPGDKDLLLPLMRELLELNITIPGSHRVGIQEQQVFATVTYPLTSLHTGDCAESISSVMALADALDDYLVDKYGGTSKQRKGQAGVNKTSD
jgi:hypothetical protein